MKVITITSKEPVTIDSQHVYNYKTKGFETRKCFPVFDVDEFAFTFSTEELQNILKQIDYHKKAKITITIEQE